MFRLLPLLFCLLALSASGAEEVAASVWQWHEANGKDGREILPMPGVKLAPSARGAFVDRRMHEVGGKRFRALYQVFDSNADNPMGRCGGGREIHLFVYELTPPKPIERGRVLISSCLETLSLASQNSGRPHSESDFSSVIWQGDGFTIEWWGIGPGGDASSHYALRNDHFVLTQPSEGNR